MTTMPFACVKAYDIRGRVPDELNTDIAYRLGRAFVAERAPRHVVVGRDIRLESPMLAEAVMRGLTDGGADVTDIGLCGTEEVYFHTAHRHADGGIMITASHNPKGYNGMKLVGTQSRPIGGESGLPALAARAASGDFPAAGGGGITVDTGKDAYIDHLLSMTDIAAHRPLTIVANPGNGAAGPVMRLLEAALPHRVHYLHAEPDGDFPNGVPNPLLPENRDATARAVVEQGADLGLAWDGDFDRCFLFDAKGRFIEGYYLVGLLAETLLAHAPGGRIVHDPRLTWNTLDQVRAAGGVPVQSKTGHGFMKAAMREADAVYGGEMSAHHYFRDFWYCDSGMIPWLLIAELMGRRGVGLESLVAARMAAYPCSGEINFRVADVPAILDRVLAHYRPLHPELDRTDGIGVAFADWRFNLRGSNTEPLLRLNVETRGDADALNRHVADLALLIGGANG